MLSFNKKNTTTYSPSQTVERVECRSDRVSYSEPSAEKNNKGVKNPDLYSETEKPPVKNLKSSNPNQKEIDERNKQIAQGNAYAKVLHSLVSPVVLDPNSTEVQRVRIGDVGKSKYDVGIYVNATYETFVNNREEQQSGLEKVATKVKKKIQE